jgi:hypothetical protein
MNWALNFGEEEMRILGSGIWVKWVNVGHMAGKYIYYSLDNIWIFGALLVNISIFILLKHPQT